MTIIQVYGIVIAVAALGMLVVLLRIAASYRKGQAAGEISEKARVAIAEIQEAVKSGDDAKVQAALLKHLKSGV